MVKQLFPVYAASSGAIARDKARATDLKARLQRPCRLCGLETWRVDATKVFSVPVFSTPDSQAPVDSNKLVIELEKVPGYSCCPLPLICTSTSLHAMEVSCKEAGLGGFAAPQSVVMCALCYVKFDDPAIKAKFDAWFTSPCSFKWDHAVMPPKDKVVILRPGAGMEKTKLMLSSTNHGTRKNQDNSKLLLTSTTKTGSRK